MPSIIIPIVGIFPRVFFYEWTGHWSRCCPQWHKHETSFLLMTLSQYSWHRHPFGRFLCDSDFSNSLWTIVLCSFINLAASRYLSCRSLTFHGIIFAKSLKCSHQRNTRFFRCSFSSIMAYSNCRNASSLVVGGQCGYEIV
jgi:hypothetical protein